VAKRGSTPWTGFIVLLALLAAAGWGLKSCLGPRDDGGGDGGSITIGPTDPPPGDGADGDGADPALDDEVKSAPPPEQRADPPPPPIKVTPEQAAAIREIYATGRARQDAGNLVEARTLLSQALASGLLVGRDSGECRTRLNAIAATLVFSREIHPGDLYAREYRVKTGDVLGRIVRQEKLYVPPEGIQRINLIPDARLIQPNQRLKLIQGPFDAIITKHAYTLDLYHHGMFVKSFRIGLGQNGSTPTGRWLVRDRVRRAQWTPPPGSNGTQTLQWNEPGYPLGKEGLWVALDGMDLANEMVSGFGLHGTNEPESIGTQASLGCIRLGDEDIALVFDLLYPTKSTVVVRP